MKKQISYTQIFKILKRVFNDRDFSKYAIKTTSNVDEIYKIDKWAREKTIDIIS